ncbi:MAG: hypothetical protein ACTSYK_06515 [Alphaproteobacteria bacterium]
MQYLAARALSAMSGLVATRAGRLLLAASAGVLGGVLALGAPASPPPDVVLSVRDPASVTVVSKETGKPAAASTAHGFKSTSVSRLLTTALAPAPQQTGQRPDAEPNLQGLSEIPRELIWNRPPPKEGEDKRNVVAAFSGVSENLPWDAVEPVHFTPLGPRTKTEETTPQPEGVVVAPAPRIAVALPADGEVQRWIKSKVTEINGSARSRPLYHFELWLEPPPDIKRRLVGVFYAFNSPAIRPQAQASSDKTNGFRISAGGLACADEVTLTLRFEDGRSQKVVLDGCKLLS